MDTTLSTTFTRPYPASSTLIRTGAYGCARSTPKGPVALSIKRVYGHPVERKILPHLTLMPEQDRIELDKALLPLFDFTKIGPCPSF